MPFGLTLASATSLASTAGEWIERIFGGDAPSDTLELHQAAARAAVVYFAGVALIRLGKGRMLGRVTPIDVIVGFLLGSLLGRAITGQASFSATIAACATIVMAHWLLTLGAVKSHRFGNVFKGHAYQIVRNGEVDEAALRRSHLSQNDLLESLRMQGVDDVREVKAAWKERNGEISVIRLQQQPAASGLHMVGKPE